MAAPKRQKAYGGGYTTASLTGEPTSSPGGSAPSAHGGAPKVSGLNDKGERQVGGPKSAEVFPTPYGGGKPITVRPDAFLPKGGGANTGGGDTGSSTIP